MNIATLEDYANLPEPRKVTVSDNKTLGVLTDDGYEDPMVRRRSLILPNRRPAMICETGGGYCYHACGNRVLDLRR